MSLEDRLRRALRRVDPGDDFAARVLARLDEGPAQTRESPRGLPRWALAASLVLVVGLVTLAGRDVWLTRTQRLEAERLRARNEAAGRQLAFALDLTSRELEGMHQHVNRRNEETGT